MDVLDFPGDASIRVNARAGRAMNCMKKPGTAPRTPALKEQKHAGLIRFEQGLFLAKRLSMTRCQRRSGRRTHRTRADKVERTRTTMFAVTCDNRTSCSR